MPHRNPSGLRVRRLLFIAALLAALAPSGPATAAASCSSQLLADWRDRRIDRTYPVKCYRETLDSLTEDIRTYSTAPDADTAPATAGNDGQGDSLPFIGVAVGIALLFVAGSLFAIRSRS